MAINTTSYETTVPSFNTSGAGADSEVPEAVHGLCWGGFLTPSLWAIGNRTWIGLLAFIPYVGWVMPFVLLFKGNEWAWRNRHWQDVEQFKRHQRAWTIAGLILNAIVLAMMLSLQSS